MPTKRAFNWENSFLVKRRCFSNFRWRASGETPSMPPPDLVRPCFSHEKPDQDRIDKIKRSVVGLSGRDCSIIPVIILDNGKGSYCLLFESSRLIWSKAESFTLNFPNNEVQEVPSCARVETEFYIKGTFTNFATVSLEKKVDYQPIQLGQDVTFGQVIYLFDFRYGSPNVEKGNVTFVDGMHFLFDSGLHYSYWAGALAFDEAGRLVGIIFGTVGSPRAILISYLRKMLGQMFPVPESIGHGVGAGPSSSSAGSSSSSM